MPKKKAIPAKAAAKSVMVVRIDLSGFGSVTDASELLATYLKEGFAIVSSAATRDSGFNRDTLYYTLVK